MEKLKEEILKIVDEHSGGLKGLELMAELFVRMGAELFDATDGVKVMDEIEKAIQEIPELGILKYDYKIDEGLYREKWFVYRKAGECPRCGTTGFNDPLKILRRIVDEETCMCGEDASQDPNRCAIQEARKFLKELA